MLGPKNDRVISLLTALRSYKLVDPAVYKDGVSVRKRQRDHLEVKTPDLVSETLIKLMIYQSMIMHRFLCYKTPDNYHQYQI